MRIASPVSDIPLPVAPPPPQTCKVTQVNLYVDPSEQYYAVGRSGRSAVVVLCVYILIYLYSTEHKRHVGRA